MLLPFLKTAIGLLPPKDKAHAHSTSSSDSVPGLGLSFSLLPPPSPSTVPLPEWNFLSLHLFFHITLSLCCFIVVIKG